MPTTMPLPAVLLGLVVTANVPQADAGSDPARAPPEGRKEYSYFNCADDGAGQPLRECTVLKISASLDSLHVGQSFEERIPAKERKDFLTLRSERFPVAVPRRNYEKTNSWVLSGKKYFKIKRSPTLVPGREVDVIAVVGNLDKLGGANKVTGIRSFDVLQNVVLTFWYDPDRGVEAIGLPRTSGDKAAFYCVRQPCLFAGGQ